MGSADVIIIGAGHNGLVAGCYLARAGIDVLVVEAAPRHGGMTGTAALIPEAPQHQINYCALDAAFIHANGIIHELELHRFGYRELRSEPEFAYLHGEGASIAVWHDTQRTVDEIARFSRRDANSYAELMDVFDTMLSIGVPLMNANPLRPGPRALGAAALAALRHHRSARKLPALMSRSLFQTVDEEFTHPVIRDAIGAIGSVCGPSRADGSAMNLMLLAWYHRFGATRPAGGTQALPDALLAKLQSHGGRLRCSSPVAEIIVTGGAASGVRLESGEELVANQAVLATSCPRTLLTRLVPEGAIDHKMARRAANIPQYEAGVAPLMIHLAFAGRLSLDRFHKERKDDADLRVSSCVVGTFEGSLTGDRDAVAGQIPRDITLVCALPTAVDPSQAPEGQDTAYLYPCPMPLRPLDGWKVAKPTATQAAIDKMDQYFEGTTALELGRWAETPDELGERMRINAGCLWHVDLTPTRMGPLRPAAGLSGYRMPLDRLYHGGGGSHPSSGISGMPGKLSAEAVMRDSAKPGRRRASRPGSATLPHNGAGGAAPRPSVDRSERVASGS